MRNFCPSCIRQVVPRARGLRGIEVVGFAVLCACTCGLGLLLTPLLFAASASRVCPHCGTAVVTPPTIGGAHVAGLR